MRHRQSSLAAAVAGASLVLLAGWIGAAPPSAIASTPAGPSVDGAAYAGVGSPGPACLTAAGEAAKCCFTHPSYAGVCVVEPAKDETCATVLSYLNNPQSQGKTYCNNTSLRGGWKAVACEEPRTTD